MPHFLCELEFAVLVLYSVQYTVGWSDLALFAILEKLHVSADQVYF